MLIDPFNQFRFVEADTSLIQTYVGNLLSADFAIQGVDGHVEKVSDLLVGQKLICRCLVVQFTLLQSKPLKV